jgi:hypothetical protein
VRNFSLILILFLASLPASAQWEEVDRHALSVDASRPDTLAYRLVRGLQTDSQKVRAVFRWITGNISYRARAPRRTTMLRDTAWDGIALDERVAFQVLRDREALCEGYARLFNTLCRYAGIRSVLVTGYARNEHDRADRGFSPNHSWNAVWLDSSWQLLDVTWASGYVRLGSDLFTPSLEEGYFLTPPDRFIRNHYPEDLRWSLLNNPEPIQEFRYAPFRTQSAHKYRIQSISPAGGLLHAVPGDTVRLQVTLRSVLEAGTIAAGSALEEGPLSTRLEEAFLEPDNRFPTRQLTYTWVVQAGAEWLHLRCNDDVILHYRVVAPAATALRPN